MLQVNAIEVGGFMATDAARVELPERGLVVVRGANGAGKSTLAEAIATAVWGSTLRGADPWRDGVPGFASVELNDGRHVTRLVDKRGKKAVDLGDTEQFATAAAAQTALDGWYGDFTTWRRTHVLSSSDSATFTGASDGERKRLLETLLGLDRFDRALAECRKALRHAQGEQAAAQSTLARAEGDLRAAETRAATAAAVAAEAEAPPDPADVADARDAQDAASREVTACSTAAVQLGKELVGVRTTLAHAKRHVERLRSMGECPTCGQVVTPDTLAQAEAVATEAEAAAAQADANLAGAVERAEAATAEAREALTAARQRFAALQQAHASSGAWVRAQAEQTAARAQADAADGAIVDAEDAVAVARYTATTLGLAEQTLGLRGVRATVTAEALAGVQTATNRWLDVMAGERLRIELRGSTERKNGAQADTIDFVIVGAGGGKGYKAASGGERRRVDVAVMLALAEVAQAAFAVPSGLLIADEVFDALDGEGVDGVAEALAELARDRCVMVITHSDALAARLPADVRLCAPFGA
jgi:DNA repair exonuclease SbcCD ATPase subunit